MEKTAELTGLLAAHAVWSVSEGETLVPILGMEMPDGGRTMRRLTEGKLEELVVTGQRWLSVNPEGAAHAVLIYDGYITLEGIKTDALLIEAHTYGEHPASFGMAIPYRQAKDPAGFAVFRPKFIAIEDMGQDIFQELVEAFFQGVDRHEQGAQVWNASLAEEEEGA